MAVAEGSFSRLQIDERCAEAELAKFRFTSSGGLPKHSMKPVL